MMDLKKSHGCFSPPITAYFISNESKKIYLEGNCGQRTNFSGGAIIGAYGNVLKGWQKPDKTYISVKQEGQAILTVELSGGKKETFLITLPKLRIDGIWYGSPYIELTESSHIQSSSGWLCTVCTVVTIVGKLSNIYEFPRLIILVAATSPVKPTPLKPLSRHQARLRSNTPLRGNGIRHQRILKGSFSTMSLVPRRILLWPLSKNRGHGRVDACGSWLRKELEKAIMISLVPRRVE